MGLFFSCNNHQGDSFTFVQLCDTQLGMGGYQNDVLAFNQAVKQINESDADFVVICGDLVHHLHDSTIADFSHIKSKLHIPCYLAAGNHDVGNVPTESSLSYFRNNIGEDYYYFTHKSYSFIVANTQLWKEYVAGESEKHDKWFKETLKSLAQDKKPLIVVGHYPVFTDSLSEKDHYFNLPQEKRSELLRLFEKYKVKAYLSGHKHTTLINNYKRIQMVSGETTSKNFDKRPRGYRFWTVTPDTLHNTFISLQMDSLVFDEEITRRN
jgi:3',5'-cyclic AMP phosphodiesterase CpdA